MDLMTIRASALADLFDCQARFYWRNIVGLRMPSSGAAHLGTALHRSTAVFDQGRIDGAGVTADDAAGEFVTALHHPETEVVWDEDQPIKKAEKIGLVLHSKYCADIAPTQNYKAVELTCEALDVETSAGTIRLTGTTDRVRVTPAGLAIADLKSGARAVGSDGRAVTSGHHLQVGVYTLLAEFALGEPLNGTPAIIGLQTTTAGRVGIGELGDVRTPLIGTEEQPGLIEIAAGVLKAGVFAPNVRSILCSQKFCPAHRGNGGPCSYHS